MATTSSSTSSAFTSISGVSTGVDWSALVDSIIKAERRPADRLQSRITAGSARKTALADLGTQLRALQTAADALKPGTLTASAFDSYTVNAEGKDASGRAVVTATVGSGATAGSYALSVSKLAVAQKLTAGKGYAADAALPKAGSFTISRPGVNGAADTPLGTVTIDASSTLTSVRDAINKLNTGTTPSGVTATIVTVSSGDQRLVLTAAQTGKANGFSLGDGGSGVLDSLGLDAAATTGAPLAQAAQDAEFTLDGVAVTRATNSATDVLPGVSMTLGAVGASTVTVARNDKAATDAAQALVDAYNKVVSTIRTQTAPGKTLAGDSFTRQLRAQLAGTLLTPAAVTATNGVAADLPSPGAAGIALQKDGTLALDTALFSQTVGSRRGEVTAMLADRMSALSGFLNTAAAPVTGQVDSASRAIDDRNTTLQTRIDSIDDRLDKRRAALLAQYSKYESAIGKLQSLQSSLTSQFSALNKASSN